MDNCEKIIENIKWFLYDDEDCVDFLKNEFDFSHETKFVSWVGDGRSFILSDGEDEYRITISKEE